MAATTRPQPNQAPETAPVPAIAPVGQPCGPAALSDADLLEILAEVGVIPTKIASKDIESGWSLFASTPQAMREIDSKGKCWLLLFDINTVRKLITTLDDLNGDHRDTSCVD